MANITINNTTKVGYLTLLLNDYFDNTDGDSEHYAPISNGITGLCVGKIEGVEYVELHISHEDSSFLLTWQTTTSNYVKTVDTVNGVAPTSINDLRDKILALI